MDFEKASVVLCPNGLDLSLDTLLGQFMRFGLTLGSLLYMKVF